MPELELHSPDFDAGGDIPQALTCDGEDRSPELRWKNAPENTQSFALIVDDPDAPGGVFTHWVLFDIPADATGLPADTSTGTPGQNDFQNAGYGGPCPPPNDDAHRYIFTLYALDVETLNLERGAKRDAVESAMRDHVLDRTQLMGQYQRGGR